jgi:hypothetical protein
VHYLRCGFNLTGATEREVNSNVDEQNSNRCEDRRKRKEHCTILFTDQQRVIELLRIDRIVVYQRRLLLPEEESPVYHRWRKHSDWEIFGRWNN